MSPTTSFVDPKLLQPHVLDADHASNETEPAHRLALFNPKLELATTGAEPGLHHGDLLLIGNRLRSRLHRLRALPDHEIQIPPAQQLLSSLD
jgi:hypothetical protein